MKNYTTKDAIQKLKPFLDSMPYGERTQLSSLVEDFGYCGAIRYLDASIPRLKISDRDPVLVNKHYSILIAL